ncbi:hypothetical protein A9P44_04310 [Paenibacillus polymyxa]|nr:hypothetical protein [Paenibacillus polymyxa]OBA06143.1 hypothetical protein A9P44_04310 [Paenibacillus polymyxa]
MNTGLWISELERIWKGKRIRAFGCVYLLALLIDIGFLRLTGGIKIDLSSWFSVDALNLPVFIMKDMSFLLQLFVLPGLFVESLADEIHSGAYRIYMLRSFDRYQHWLVKLLTQIVLIVSFIFGTTLVSLACGWLFFSHPQSTVVYLVPESIGYGKVLWLTIQYDLLLVLTSIAVLVICSVFSILITRVSIVYACTILGLLGSYVIVSELRFLHDPFVSILRVLCGQGSMIFWMYLTGIIVICPIISFWIWSKRGM